MYTQPRFRVRGTVTGRLSISEPARQDMPQSAGRARLTFPRLTFLQSVLLRAAEIHGTVTVAGQVLTKKELSDYLLAGKQPQDEALARELDLLTPTAASNFVNLELSTYDALHPDTEQG